MKWLKDLAIYLLGYNKQTIKSEIKEIFNQSYYKPGMALNTFNGDSQRYWKLKNILTKWF